MKTINNIYIDILKSILETGDIYEDPNRRGTLRKQIPFVGIMHDFKDGFPIIGIKQSYPKTAFNEMKAFMSGVRHLKGLWDMGVNFWNKDAFNYHVYRLGNDTMKDFMEGVEEGRVRYGEVFGDLGRIYSHQIRNWNDDIDQLNEVLNRLKGQPRSTKNVVTMWNPSDLGECALSPCHRDFEFIVSELSMYARREHFERTYSAEVIKNAHNGVRESEWKEYLDYMGVPKYGLRIKWSQHSVDTFLGLPMNILYYAHATHVFAHYLGMVPLGIIGTLSNVHLYDNTWEKAQDIIDRADGVDFEKVDVEFRLPTNYKNLDDYLQKLNYNDCVHVKNYTHLGKVDAEMLPYKK